MARKAPVHFSQGIADEICERMSDGESLTQICRDDHMPSKSTVTRWSQKDVEGFAEQYARAREDLLAYYADEIVDIADDGRNDWIEREGRNGDTFVALNKEAVDRSKLRVEARKWLLTKLKPKEYGDKVDVKHDATEAFANCWKVVSGGAAA